MLQKTKELIKLVETRDSEPNASTEAHELLRQGADITAPTRTGPMIHSIIAGEKRYRPVIPWRADNCQHLIGVLQKGASDRLSAQVLAADGGGGDLKEMHRLVQLKASCYQSTTFGPLGLLGTLLKQEKIPIRLDIVKFLVENDPCTKHSLTLAEDQQQTILSLAKNNSNCSQDILDYLQQQFDAILNQTPFVQPQIDPHEVIMWIHRGANPEAIDQYGNTVLSNAVITDNLKLVRLLVSAGSNTTHRNADDLTPVQIAKRATPRSPPLIAILEAQQVNAQLKQLIETKKSQLTTDEVRSLLENGADINATIVNQDSFLHLLIASEGTPEMITAFVIDFNADLSATNLNGYRPIELCILRDEDPFVYLPTFLKLPKMTTNLFTNSTLNKTLLQFAMEKQRCGAAKVIQDELSLRLWTCMTQSINTHESDHEIIRNELQELVACGAQINYRHRDKDYQERTVLHVACKIGADKLVEYLIKDLQADYTLPNHNGDTPLSIVADYGHLSIVTYLCGLLNSTLNLFNKDQQTPLHLATKKGHLLVVRHLVKRGADHQAQNGSKQTAHDIARANISQNKDEQMNDKRLIHFLEQLICPPVDDTIQQPSSIIQPTYDLDTCELVPSMVVINPIRMSSDDTDGVLGKQRKGLFSRSLNDSPA